MAEAAQPAGAEAPPAGGGPNTGQNDAAEGQEPKGADNGNGGKGSGGGDFLGGMLPILLVMFAVMYFMVIRPQKKKERQRRELLGGVRANDEIVTIGGIHGMVTVVKENEVIVRVDDKTKLRFNRSAVARIIRDGKDLAETS